MPSKQETFDTVARHLFTQREIAGDVNGCCYRIEVDGRILRCAAGCLIPDEKYSEDMEGWGVETNKKAPAFQSNFGGHKATECLKSLGYDLKLVEDLQVVHDSATEGADPVTYLPLWKRGLRNIANTHDLDASVLDEVASDIDESLPS